MDPKTPTIGERIVVHLSQYRRQGDAYVAPPEMSQGGIATALGISRAHAAIELKRAREAGRVEVRMAHVTGAPTRRKVYRLTPKGEGLARAVRNRVLGRIVELVLPDGRAEVMPGLPALQALRRFGVAEGRAVLLLLSRTRIDVRQPNVRRPSPPQISARSPEARAVLAFERVFVRPVAWQFDVVLGPPHAPPVPAAA